MDNKDLVSVIYTRVLANKPKSFTTYSDIKFPKYDKLPYQLLDRIGHGASGQVYEAKDLKTGKLCAIKIISTIGSNIQKEVLILRNLKSINVIQLYDAFHYSDNYYLVFELVTVLSKTIRGNESIIEINFIMYQLLKALQFCHSNGIIHCDIKPSNIGLALLEKAPQGGKTTNKISEDASEENKILYRHKTLISSSMSCGGVTPLTPRILKLLDFGHAQFYWPDNTYSPALGTVVYRAPELLFESKHFSYAVDIWSAGIIFFQLLFPKILPSSYQVPTKFPLSKVFLAKSNEEQILNLNELFGTSAITNFCEKYNLNCYKLPMEKGNYQEILKDKSFGMTVKDNADLLLAIDLLNKMLEIDPIKRINCNGALEHPYFAHLR